MEYSVIFFVRKLSRSVVTKNVELRLKKQFNTHLLGKDTERKAFSSFRKFQNNLINLLGLFSP